MFENIYVPSRNFAMLKDKMDYVRPSVLLKLWSIILSHMISQVRPREHRKQRWRLERKSKSGGSILVYLEMSQKEGNNMWRARDGERSILQKRLRGSRRGRTVLDKACQLAIGSLPPSFLHQRTRSCNFPTHDNFSISPFYTITESGL